MKFHQILALAVLVLASAFAAQAQEVIMNQPSADIVDKGKTFVRFDEFYTQNPSFYQENVNLAYGLGHNLEVSLNNTNAFNRAPLQDNLVLGFKYAPIKLKNGFEIYVGDQFVQPLTHKVPGFSQGNISYEAAAYSTHGWRFTAGSFQSHNGVSLGNRTGAIGGIEYMKMLTKNFGVGPGVDYASGAGTNGYTSPGLNFMYKSFFVCPGYMIANPKNPNGAHQSFVMIGYTF
jgi:hypothetical protein